MDEKPNVVPGSDPVVPQGDLDILRRRIAELEAELKEARALVYIQEAEMKSLGRGLNHDLRAPIRAVVGFTKAVLEDQGENLDDTSRDYLKRVLSAGGNLSELIDQLVLLTKTSSTEIRKEQVDLSSMAAEIMAELKMQAPKRTLELEIEPAITVRGDSRLLRLALERLLSNALKFSSGRDLAKVSLRVRHDLPGSSLVVSVEDNGAGFDPEQAHKLFIPFQKLHPTADFPGGTGMGLAISRNVIERHGGQIWAESKPGSGAVFSFSIPVDRVEKKTA